MSPLRYQEPRGYIVAKHESVQLGADYPCGCLLLSMVQARLVALPCKHHEKQIRELIRTANDDGF